MQEAFMDEGDMQVFSRMPTSTMSTISRPQYLYLRVYRDMMNATSPLLSNFILWYQLRVNCMISKTSIIQALLISVSDFWWVRTSKRKWVPFQK